MMQNWKRELEELLYHLGIYLSQDGYPVICAAADLVLQGAGAAAAGHEVAVPGGGRALPQDLAKCRTRHTHGGRPRMAGAAREPRGPSPLPAAAEAKRLEVHRHPRPRRHLRPRGVGANAGQGGAQKSPALALFFIPG